MPVVSSKTTVVKALLYQCKTQRLISAMIKQAVVLLAVPSAVCLCHAGWSLDPGQGRRDLRGWGQTLGPSCVYPSCFPHTEKPWDKTRVRHIGHYELNKHIIISLALLR